MFGRVNGYTVVTSEDGLAAIEVAKREKPDLIILDFMLPSIPGYEVCDKLKQDPQCAKIPILMFSARNQKADMEGRTGKGADAYLGKPCDSKVLLKTIQTLIDRS